MNIFRAVFLCGSLLLPFSATAAQLVDPLAGREDKIVPAVLMWLQETGVKLTYLGNEGGIRGYLAESATGNMQTVYVAPTPTYAVIGLLYGMDYSQPSSNLTGQQLDELRKRYDAVATAVAKIDLNDVKSVQQALSEINVPKPSFEIGAMPSIDDKAPILNKLREDGYDLTLLGTEGGLVGYFAKKNGIGQSVYVTPDGKHVVVGILVQRGGKNVTGVQVGEMKARFESEKAASGKTTSSSAASKISNDATTTSSSQTPSTSSSIDPGTAASKQPVQSPTISSASQSDKTETPASSNAPTPPSSPSAPEHKAEADLALPSASGPVAEATGNPSSMFYSDIDRKQFMDAAREASWFDVGFSSAPVTVYMVDDPNCPYCHKTWDYLRSFVTARKVKIRVIMIAFLKGSDVAAREIMASANPGLRFLESDAGEHLGQYKVDPNSSEYKAISGHLANNRKFTTKFDITATPFIAYEGTDGNFYSSRGADNLDAFFHAAGLTK